MKEQIEMITDLLKVQQSLPTVTKEGVGNFGKYLKLDDLMPKVLEVLNKNGFVLYQAPSVLDGKPALDCVLMHKSGATLQTTMLLMLDKDTAQGQGSAITYARRYSLCSILGLVADEDDDGQKATDTKSNGGELPSDEQTALAKDLMHKRGYEGVEAMDICEKLIGKKIPQTKKDYSKLIGALIKLPRKETNSETDSTKNK